MTQYAVDYSWQHPGGANIKNAGYVGVLRYLSHEPEKNLGPAERDEMLNLGLGIGLVWETTANRALAGFDAGVQDAHEANAQADALGHPDHKPIYFAVDVPTSAASVHEYFRGAVSVSKRPVGVYGPYDVIEGICGGDLKLEYGWQSAGGSGMGTGSAGSVVCSDRTVRRLSQYACLFQDVGGSLAGTDRNIIYKSDWGQWTNSAAPSEPTPAPTPTTEENIGMEKVKFPDDDKIYLHGFDRNGEWFSYPKEYDPVILEPLPTRILGAGDDDIDARWQRWVDRYGIPTGD